MEYGTGSTNLTARGGLEAADPLTWSVSMMVTRADGAVREAPLHNTTDPLLSTCVWARARVGTVHWDMCTYPPKVDRWVSAAVQRTGCWLECTDVEWMLGVLSRSRLAQLVDVGGNIGFYTCAAAAAGHAVTVFEPSLDNGGHLLASVRRNGWRHVRLFSLCVSDASAPCELSGHRDNQGALQHSIGSESNRRPWRSTRDGQQQMRGTAVNRFAALGRSRPTGWRPGMVTTMAVRIDEVLPPSPRPLFLKVDIEGGECAAFRGMASFLNRSASIIGALVEFDKSRACCEELIAPPVPQVSPAGAFWTLAVGHGLCAYLAPAAHLPHVRPTTLANLCKLRGAAKQLNLRWEPCH